MSKYSTFSHYRSELINIVRRLEYVENGKTVEWAKFAHIEDIIHLSGAFFYLGHQEAGEQTAKLRNEIMTIKQEIERKAITVEKLAKYDEKWQRAAMQLKPSFKVLFGSYLRL